MCINHLAYKNSRGRQKEAKFIKKRVLGPLHTPIEVKYGILSDGTAVIEFAKVAGLALVPEKSRNPMQTTSYGVGELIKAVTDDGAKKVILCAGVSATCDGGTGILASLGMKFIDANGKYFIPVGGTLLNIKEVESHRGGATEIIVLYDVSNPLLGPDGATRVYAPQKGADDKEVETLERGLTHFCEFTLYHSKSFHTVIAKQSHTSLCTHNNIYSSSCRRSKIHNCI